MVNEFMVSITMSPYNTRVFMSEDKNTLELRVASVATKKEEKVHEFNGHKIQVSHISPVFDDYVTHPLISG